MKIINPNYKDADKLREEKYATLVKQYLAGLPTDQPFIDYEKIKADILSMNLPGVTDADITEEKIEKLARANGLLVIQ